MHEFSPISALALCGTPLFASPENPGNIMNTSDAAPPPAGNSRWSDARGLALIALGYAFTLKLALFLPDAAGVLAAVWPPGGVALAALLLKPRRQQYGILATIFVAGNVVNLLSGRPAFASVGFMVANVLESWGCAWLFARWFGTRRLTFARIDEVLALAVGAIAVNSVTVKWPPSVGQVGREIKLW